MTIALQPEHEKFIQAQLATGRYASALEVISEALQLLEKRNEYDYWVEKIRAEIDMAAGQLDQGQGIEGETVVAHLRAKLHQAHEA